MMYSKACFTKAHSAAIRELEFQIATARDGRSQALVLAAPDKH